uniref:PLP-dependent transferase n=1 Tax=Bacillus mycoides TaxID=1405 RepID=UPI00164334F3
PFLKVTHIPPLSQLPKSPRPLTFLHNTFLTPLFQKPLQLPPHVLLHTPTKFIPPHTHLTPPLPLLKHPQLPHKLPFFQNPFPPILPPNHSSL